MDDNFFTMLCCFLPYNNVNQPKVYICPHPLEPLSLPPLLPPLWISHRIPGLASCVIEQLPIIFDDDIFEEYRLRILSSVPKLVFV